MKMKHGMLSLLVALCLVIGLLPGMALAAEEVASGTCGENLTWVLDSDGVLTISGEGEMTDYYSYLEPSPWYDYRSQITAVVIENGVTTIGEYAFYGCDSLTSVTIPNSVTTISNSAFSGCDSLLSIEVDPENANYSSQDGVLFNKDMTELIACPGGKTGEYVIPGSVITIGNSAFQSCHSLISVTIPASVTSIGDYAFQYCTHPTTIITIIFEGDAPEIAYNAFSSVTATAYYPAGNETWTEDVMQDYEGDITWVAYTATEPEHTDPETTEPETTEPETTEPETTEPETTEPETTEPETTNPKTGDSAPLTACIVLMLLAAAAVVTARKRMI